MGFKFVESDDAESPIVFSSNALNLNIVQKEINYDKVQTIEDIKNILRGWSIVIYDDGSDRFAPIRPYLREI